MKYERRRESFYDKSRFIAEYYNTLSNLPFIIIGFMRILEMDREHNDHVLILYLLYIACGFCSGIHHMLPFKWSIVIDYVPIVMTIYYFICNYEILIFISLASWFKILLSLLILFNDHVYRTIIVPWGHVMWHLMASMSIDSAYMDISAIKMVSRYS